MVHKVLAYIVRQSHGQRALLVFRHRDYPEAGLQVPAGTVDPGEDAGAALVREIGEEAGLQPAQVRVVKKLAEHVEAELNQLRHIYHVAPVGELPERWSHTVLGNGGDGGMVFEFYWVAPSAELKLAGGQERFLHLLGEG